MLISISNTTEKMNINYKPLIVAVFLVVGGLLAGSLFLPKSGVTEKKGAPGAPFLLPTAEGAELDSAAVLKGQDAPFLTSGDPSNGTVAPILWIAAPSGEGALEDPRSL